MLQRWKLILTNWINCYFNNASKDEHILNIESLLSIISHLRENLNLDESKSSILEAHTVEEFLTEKYPEFKFGNGTVQAGNEEEICLSASLLLFFVCVNSKNLDIKNAMCSKLGSEDQKTILNFSKCLMECSVITVGEVQAAITEACGQDIAAMELPNQFLVAETPPALRSLHSEVRRLQAALDAERFDRNYLQEELSRTNGRLEQLLKEKEQHKLDILNLKAKISLFCGEEADAKNADASADRTVKLTRQLQQLEERMETVQTQLDDAVYERDTYKAKINELKHERDKWLALSQQENARVSQLTDELDTERRHVQSLKDLVAELRQHNSLNRLDTSLLECDDPDTSIHSLQHNSSICSEVCANVVEVQLGEERAKILVLKQQIQTLQDQINELNQKAETEKKTLENVVAQKENIIFNLKHRINEEIEEKNNLKAHCDNEMTKLNNEINELEQKLKDNNDYSRSIIEKKLEEIQTLQEEKLSLLHSLNNETTKLENTIKDLKSHIDTERQARSSMKEGYENHIMKLNEKVLNRNNELVELQNGNFEKGEKIEMLQMELKREKETLHELNNKYENMEEQKASIENDLRHKSEEVQNLHIKLQRSSTVIEDVNMEVNQLKTSISSLVANCKTLEEVKKQLIKEIEIRDTKIEETLKDMNHITEVFTKEKEKLSQDLDERNATVNSLQTQLQNEIQFKIGLQNELSQIQTAKTSLSEEFEKINAELSKLKIEIEDKDRTIDAMDLYIQDEKKRNNIANEKIQMMTDCIKTKENDLKTLKDILETTKKSLHEQIQNNEDNAEVAQIKLLTEIAERETVQLQLDVMLKEKSHIEKDLSLKCEEIFMLQDDCEELSQKLNENEILIQALEQKLNDECKKCNDIHLHFSTEMSTIKTKVSKMQNAVIEATTIMESKIMDKESTLHKLVKDLEIIKKNYLNTTINLQRTQNENKVLISQLNEEIMLKNKLEEENKNKNIMIEDLTSQLNAEVVAHNTETDTLKLDIQSLLKTIDEKKECLKTLQITLAQDSQSKCELLTEKEMEIMDLQNKIIKLQTIENELEQEFRREIEIKTQAIQVLEKENKQLKSTFEEQNINHEVIINGKDIIIDKLEHQLKENIVKFEDLKQYNEDLQISWENYKAEAKAAVKENEDKIAKLNDMAITFEQMINEVEQQKGELTKRIMEIEETNKIKLDNLATEEKALRDLLVAEKENLLSEKTILLKDKVMLEQELTEVKSVKMIVEIEKKKLLCEKQSLLEEKAMLAQELAEERSIKNIVEEEKNMLLYDKMEMKQQLNKQLETNNALIQEKECLTQQLIEEKLTKEITEKEKELVMADKELLKEKLNESEKIKCELSKDIDTLNRNKEILQQELKQFEEALLIKDKKQTELSEGQEEQKINNQNLLQKNQNLVDVNDQLKKELMDIHSLQELLQEKNHSLLIENDKLKKYLLDVNSLQKLLKVEKESLEATLCSVKYAHDEIETDKNYLAVKFNLELINKEEENKSLINELEKMKETIKENIEAQDALAKEKECLVQVMKTAEKELIAAKESLKKALTYEKSIQGQTHSELNALPTKSELNLINKEGKKQYLLQEIEQLNAAIVENNTVNEILIKEKNFAIAEKEQLEKALSSVESNRDKTCSEINNLTVKYEINLMKKEVENKSLLEEIEKLKAILEENKAVQDSLIEDRKMVVAEKESLDVSLSIEKCARDEIETEKKDLTMKLESLTDKVNHYNNAINEYENTIGTKRKETKKYQTALKQLEADHRFLQDYNSKILVALSDHIDKLKQKLGKDNLNNEVLQKLMLLDKNFEDVPLAEACELIVNIADALSSELSHMKKLEVALKNEKVSHSEIQETLKQKEAQISNLQTEVKRLEQILNEKNTELTKQSETYTTSINSKINDIQTLRQENQTLYHDLNDVKVQLEVKVHSLKEKLTDNEHLTDKLKKSYECQIDNLNVMITKLTSYLKEKTVELEALRKDKDILQHTVGDSCKIIKTLQDEVKVEKQNIGKLMSDFESERQVLKNMVTVTESVMEDQKLSLNNVIAEHALAKDCLHVENNELKSLLKDLESKCLAQEMANSSLHSLLRLERNLKKDVEIESENVREHFDEVIYYLNKERNANTSVISALEFQERVLAADYEKMKKDLEDTRKVNQEMKEAMSDLELQLHEQDEMLDDAVEQNLQTRSELVLQTGLLEKALKEKNEVEKYLEMEKEKVENMLQEKSRLENDLQTQRNNMEKVLEEKSKVENMVKDKSQHLTLLQLENKEMKNKFVNLLNEKESMELEKREGLIIIEDFKAKINSIESKENEEIVKLNNEIQQLLNTIEENKSVITNLEQLIKHELEENHKLRDNNDHEKHMISNKCSLLQDYQNKVAKELEEHEQEILTLKKEVETLQLKIELCEQESRAKDGIISKMCKEKDAVINTISKELVEEKAIREKCEKEIEAQKSAVSEMKNNMEIRVLKKENEQLIRAIGQQETFTALCQEKAIEKYACQAEPHDHPQVDNSSSNNTNSSVESFKTITDLEKIIHDKNRTITTLQTDITYLKSLMAESENKLLDVNKELEISRENCHQLSSQLKKIVYQKNEEIAELKKQVTKMSATENRASQIIKVSAKYQAMILKKIAEIKSSTVLKELTNFGNSNTCDNELRRSLNAGTITMEDLENFLETTDRHLKRCTEKQIALQKERDRLAEVNRINESEIINLKKFLTELSVSFQTFSSMKDLYSHKLSRVISVQRTVRREILGLDGRITDAAMCKLERGYGAAMQDLAECTMNLERWLERCISRTVSVEKIKQAFTSDSERSSLASPSFQNTGLEIQLEELDKSFQKLLEEVARAVKGEGTMESQASTVMEVRAEYEDKLNRMKSKMKDLFNEQMAVLKNKQREDIALLERELQKTRDRMEDSKHVYENHIRELTKELWRVGEKYLVKNDEAEWLRKKQRSGSLMSLQHVHSSGLIPTQEVPSRASDAHSLRSLPVSDNNPKGKREGRGLHMSDEEGEVFDNRWLKELATPTRRDAPPPLPGQRLSELKWRNSLCPPHLKSSYPAETQFAPVLDEEEIKALAMGPAGRSQRKEVGITAYKKPGPPTPSKQAGRLSATDSELRESLRVDNDPHAHTERKTSTPARFRAFLRFNKNDTNEGTPRARRLSNIFRKK